MMGIICSDFYPNARIALRPQPIVEKQAAVRTEASKLSNQAKQQALS